MSAMKNIKPRDKKESAWQEYGQPNTGRKESKYLKVEILKTWR